MWLFDIEQAILVLGIRIVLCESQQCQSSLSWFVSSTESCAESLECIIGTIFNYDIQKKIISRIIKGKEFQQSLTWGGNVPIETFKNLTCCSK